MKNLIKLTNQLINLRENTSSSLEAFQVAYELKQEADKIYDSYMWYYDYDVAEEISEQESEEYTELHALYNFFNETLKEVLVSSMAED